METRRRYKPKIPRCRNRSIVPDENSFLSKLDTSSFSLFSLSAFNKKSKSVSKKAASVNRFDEPLKSIVNPVKPKKKEKENKIPDKVKRTRKKNSGSTPPTLPTPLKERIAEIDDIDENYELHVTKGSNNSNHLKNGKLTASNSSSSNEKFDSALPTNMQIGTSTPSLFGKADRKPYLPAELSHIELFSLNEPVFENSQICVESDALLDSNNYQITTTYDDNCQTTNSNANLKIGSFTGEQQQSTLSSELIRKYTLRSGRVVNVTTAGESSSNSKIEPTRENYRDDFQNFSASGDMFHRFILSPSQVHVPNSVFEKSEISYKFCNDEKIVESSIYNTADAFLDIAASGKSAINVTYPANRNLSSTAAERQLFYFANKNVSPTLSRQSVTKDDSLENRNLDYSMKSVVDEDCNELRNFDNHDDAVGMEMSDNNNYIVTLATSLVPEDQDDEENIVEGIADLVTTMSIEKCRNMSNISKDALMSTRNVSRLSFADVCSPYFLKHRRSAEFDPATVVYQLCGQEDGPVTWDCAISSSVMEKCVKIGEGTYGEVFKTTNLNGEFVALKIIPIEGNFNVNDEPQKSFEEILPEILIASEMSSLKNNERNNTPNFVEVKSVSCVRGRYPEKLLNAWDDFKQNRISENDRPDVFKDQQLFIIFEFGDGGTDLENFSFSNVDQAKSVLIQTTLALTVAESVLEFEHRDLHIGNILVKKTKEKYIDYEFDGCPLSVKSSGVHVYLIDFTNSRLHKDGCTIFTNLANDEGMFNGQGDYQFDIYRLMKELNGNEWKHFEPKTNLLWLHYLINKLCTCKKYRGKSMSAKLQSELNSFGDELLKRVSCEDFVLHNNVDFFNEIFAP